MFIATTVGFGAVFLFGRTGEVVRPVVLPMRDSRVRPSASFVTIMVERIYDMIAVVLLFAINLLWFIPPVNGGVEFGRVRAVGLVLLFVAVAGVFGLAIFRRKSHGAIGWVRRDSRRQAVCSRSSGARGHKHSGTTRERVARAR